MIKRNRNAILIICSSFLLLIASIIVVGGSSGKSGPPKTVECRRTEKLTTLIFFDNFPIPTNRNQSFLFAPVSPSLFSSSPSPSASSLTQNPRSRYYCEIRITDLDCKNDTYGQRFYLWNSQTNDNRMNILVPEFNNFKVTVTYYENCGLYWNINNTYPGRGIWSVQKTFIHASYITMSHWQFDMKIDC